MGHVGLPVLGHVGVRCRVANSGVVVFVVVVAVVVPPSNGNLDTLLAPSVTASDADLAWANG